MDAVLEEFFRLCSLAGPSRCKFWRRTPELIRESFWKLDDQIHTSPVVFPSLQVFDWSAWRNAVVFALYSPITSFSGNSGLAEIAAYASNPNITDAGQVNLTLPNDILAAREQWLTDPDTGFKNGDESLVAIRCLDHPRSSVDNAKEFEDYLKSEAVQKLGRLGQSVAGLTGMLCGRTLLSLLTPRTPI